MQRLNSDAASYVPHEGRMCLIDRIRSFDKEARGGQVSLNLREKAPYFFEGRFQSHWLIEICAQASAALSQILFREKSDKAPPPGYLISVRAFDFEDDVRLKVDDELVVDVVFDVEINPVGQSRCEVRFEQRRIAAGEMTFYSQEA